MQNHLALLRVELGRLLTEEPIDVGIAAVGVRAARGGERLDPRGRVAGDAAQAVDDVLQLLLLIGLHERRALQRAELRPDAGRLEIVLHRLAETGGPRVAPEISGVEAFGVPGLREELPGLRGVVLIDRRLPVELEAGRDEAPGDLREPEGLRLVDRLAVDRVGRGEAHAAVVPG